MISRILSLPRTTTSRTGRLIWFEISQELWQAVTFELVGFPMSCQECANPLSGLRISIYRDSLLESVSWRWKSHQNDAFFSVFQILSVFPQLFVRKFRDGESASVICKKQNPNRKNLPDSFIDTSHILKLMNCFSNSPTKFSLQITLNFAVNLANSFFCRHNSQKNTVTFYHRRVIGESLSAFRLYYSHCTTVSVVINRSL